MLNFKKESAYGAGAWSQAAGFLGDEAAGASCFAPFFK